MPRFTRCIRGCGKPPPAPPLAAAGVHALVVSRIILGRGHDAGLAQRFGLDRVERR
jgi:hypothetical protein